MTQCDHCTEEAVWFIRAAAGSDGLFRFCQAHRPAKVPAGTKGGRLCEDCHDRPSEVILQGHGALWVAVCHQCEHGDEDRGTDSWHDHGWAERCEDCGGSGRYDDVMPCGTCDGEGTVPA